MIGASCQVRGLMVPYLILQMLVFIVWIVTGAAVTLGLCFVNAIVAVIAGVTVLISSGLLLYFWIAVQRAYVELGNNDYMYSPAPIKPMTQYNDGRGYYPPTSPQHFQMDDRKWPVLMAKKETPLSLKSGFWDHYTVLSYFSHKAIFRSLFFFTPPALKTFSVLRFCCSFCPNFFGIFSHFCSIFVHLVTHTHKSEEKLFCRKKISNNKTEKTHKCTLPIIKSIWRKALYRNTALTGVNF